MPELVKKHGVEVVVFAYSDVPYEYVMHRSALVNSLGADFMLMGPDKVMVKSTKPVIAVCAVRTGAGKSQTTRKIQTMLREAGKKVVSIRHPMPYGDLVAQRVQRYATLDDLKKYECTIEEMEEYEPHVKAGNVIYAGVDYEAIVREAEKEADIILWDGGNNDFSLLRRRPVHHRRRPAPPRRRPRVLPGRSQPAARRRHRPEQDRLGRPRRHRGRARRRPLGEPDGADHHGRLAGHRRQARDDQGQARPRGRGRPDAHARRDEVRRRHRGRQAVRRGRVHRPAAVRGRRDQGDLREVPERRRPAAGHGLLGAAAQGPGGRRSTPPAPTWSSSARRWTCAASSTSSCRPCRSATTCRRSAARRSPTSSASAASSDSLFAASGREHGGDRTRAASGPRRPFTPPGAAPAAVNRLHEGVP